MGGASGQVMQKSDDNRSNEIPPSSAAIIDQTRPIAGLCKILLSS